MRTEVVEEAEIPYERTLYLIQYSMPTRYSSLINLAPFSLISKVLWVMKSDERDVIRDLLKQVTDIRRPQPNHRNSALHAFLYGDDPTSLASPPDEEFVPIFPRSRRRGNGSAMAHKKSFQELLELVPEVDIASEDSDTNIMNANLEMVGGWR